MEEEKKNRKEDCLHNKYICRIYLLNSFQKGFCPTKINTIYPKISQCIQGTIVFFESYANILI